MASSFATITQEALGLTPRQRLKLAEVLLVSADTDTDGDCHSAWEQEIDARIQRIDEGREIGIPFEEVMAAADQILTR